MGLTCEDTSLWPPLQGKLMGVNEGSLYIYFNGKIAFLKIADTMEFFFF